MERFLDILNCVKKNGNSTFHSCEPELIELMRQIDEMIEEKKLVWEKEMNELERQLQSISDDNKFLCGQVEDSKGTILNMKEMLEEERKSHRDTLTQYNKDVKILRDDLNNIKKKYRGLQKKVELARKRKSDVISSRSEVSSDAQPLLCTACKSKLTNDEVLGNTSREASSTETPPSDLTFLKLQYEAICLENDNLRSILAAHAVPFLQQLESSGEELIEKKDSIKESDTAADTDKRSVGSSNEYLGWDDDTSIDKSIENRINDIVNDFEINWLH